MTKTLLHHKKIVQLLVENGAAPGWTLGRLEMPQILKEVLQGKHSLLAAAALGNVQAVSEHIAKGADLGARNLRGQTALLLAILNSAQKRSSQENSRRPWTSEEDDLIVRNYWSMDPPPQPNMESGGRLHVSRHRFHLLILTSVECVRAHPPAQACPSCCICFHVVTKCVDLY